MATLKKNLAFKLLLILVLGGIGGVLMDRLVLPYLSAVPGLRNLHLGSQATPVMINTREEVQIDDGINNADVLSRVKSSLVTVYEHSAAFSDPKFRVIQSVDGVIVTSDGIVVVPAAAVRSDLNLTVLVVGLAAKPAKLIATDPLMGLAFLKIDAHDLSVIKQGFSEDLQIGERLLVLAPRESTVNAYLQSTVVSGLSLALAGLQRIYDLSRPNATLQTGLDSASVPLGAVFVNRDGALVGFATQIGKDIIVLRSEDLKLSVNNFLTDQKISWPAQKVSYEILGEDQTPLLNLSQKNGILVKSAVLPLRENDFVYAVDGNQISPRQDFQDLILQKNPGDKVTLSILRAGTAMQIQITL
jgi:S1-C subfamily serine protease